MQLHLFQPKKIHSEQSNGLLRVLSVGPPRENIMLQFRCCMLWLSHRALAQATIHCDITPLASQLMSLHENAAHAHIASTVPIVGATTVW
eukprot:COSAG01_NODE_49251_length_373_cov_31.226277_1_plen_90_part_10